MKQYTFLLNLGYAESQKIGYIPFKSTNRFKDAKVALLDLAEFLKEKCILFNELDEEISECCIESKEQVEDAIYCYTCGCKLNEKTKLQVGDFEEFLYGLNNACNDELSEKNFDDRWQAGQIGPMSTVRMVYNAERVLSAAIGLWNGNGGRYTIEEIFANRTKSKSEDFSYYV